MSKSKTGASATDTARTESPEPVAIPADIEAAIDRASKAWRVPSWVLRALYASAHRRPAAAGNVTGMHERGKPCTFVSAAMCIDRTAVALAQSGANFADVEATAKALAPRFPKATLDDYTLYQEA